MQRHTYYLRTHQHKGRIIRQVLKSCGWLSNGNNPDIAFFDRDYILHNDGNPKKKVQEFHKRGAKIVLYPHSALPPWWYDELVPLYDGVHTILVIGENQKKVMKIIAPEARVYVMGWCWSRQEKFTPCEKPKNILFAPIHGSGNNLRPEAREANRKIFESLLSLYPEININVRYIGNLELQGLWKDRRVDWSSGRPDGRYHQIDRADLVIAEGTYMYLSVARGKPTIGINQHLPIRANRKPETFTPKNWDSYAHLLAYPINFGDAPLMELMKYAGVNEQSEWRNLLIGDNINYTEFEHEMRAIING
jgi:hypothetical protein